MDDLEVRLVSGLAQDARDVVEDVHHRLRDRKLIGKADVLAHVFAMAEQSGVPRDERERLATEAYGRLVKQASPRRRRWR